MTNVQKTWIPTVIILRIFFLMTILQVGSYLCDTGGVYPFKSLKTIIVRVIILVSKILQNFNNLLKHKTLH